MTTITAAERDGNHVPHDPSRTRRLVVHVPLDFADELEEYRRRTRAMTMSDALRRLLSIGLETEAERERATKPQR